MNAYGTTYATWLSYGPILLQGLAGNLFPRLPPESTVVPAAVVGMTAILLAGLADRRLRAIAVIVTLSVAGVTMLGAVTGKFAPRYAAMTAPLVATMLGVLIGEPIGAPVRSCAPVRRLTTGARLATGSAVCVMCLAGILVLRTDPSFANEDFRGATAFLRQQLAADETVLLVSGHFAPVFRYYFGEGDWHPIPADPVLNVGHTLDYTSAAPLLNHALAHKRGAWLLLWQDREIDPTGIVPLLLQRIAHQLQPDLTLTQFHGLRLVHYRFDTPYQVIPETLPATDSKIEETDRQRGLEGLGCHQFRSPHAGDVMMEVACFWQLQPGARLPYDTHVSLRLIDANGTQVAQSDQMLAQPLGLPNVPFEKPITSFYFVAIPGDLSAGAYTLRAIPYTPGEQIAPLVTTPVEVLPR
jgi:hypothetical protein